MRIQMYAGIFADNCVSMIIDMCVDMCIDMCADICTYACMGRHIDMRTDIQ